ncbi:MAG: aminotransferase class III-fold pyridoxal phosphate-dependent enzyme, partial [Chloroflexota bacterium]|nr:aminotransferase class III-fold pyridoxal phosphate-dependent enzyme [Chloroflexota bacterium]
AIEALNIIKDEGLVDRARDLGEYLGQQLRNLQIKYPDRINDVRGRGLLWGVELRPALEQLEPLINRILPGKSPILATFAGAIVLSELFHNYNVLAYLGFTRRNLIVFSPPLIISKSELDQAIEALDAVLSTNWLKLGSSFIARQFLAKK